MDLIISIKDNKVDDIYDDWKKHFPELKTQTQIKNHIINDLKKYLEEKIYNMRVNQVVNTAKESISKEVL